MGYSYQALDDQDDKYDISTSLILIIFSLIISKQILNFNQLHCYLRLKEENTISPCLLHPPVSDP